ncbi:conserved hypothetical protein [Pyrobaculum islandicum DSM 4184]|uniref:Uncharacterized protein n=1 Tax=Pyrobaculum islandicum (strain DSM 4184 / JCM 9189 / GEO3) TaxID=384616 RepID=A1RRD6_PYRIL|nr:hypothetical protein [Pyrobaculum islandicum]ABL87518.1 conserved hypothetical protein [Pyrobaculum islandicum DSM 4184]
MDLTLLFITTIAVSITILGLIMYRLVKSLEIYLIPLYAEIIRKRERDYILMEFLTSLLVSKGLVTQVEADALKKISTTEPLTVEDLDKIDEILNKDPSQLTFEEITDLKRVAYKLLGRLDKKSVRLGMKLLKYAVGIEETFKTGVELPARSKTEKVEISYDYDTCSVYLTTYRRDGTIEKTQGPDLECVTETAMILKALARRSTEVNKELAEKALARYKKCKESDTAGCKALKEALSTLERKSLDLLLERKH